MIGGAVSLRTVQLALALAYAAITAAALLNGQSWIALGCGVAIFGFSCATSRPLADVAMPVRWNLMAALPAVAIMLVLIVWMLVARDFLLPAIIAASCAGNRMRAGGVGSERSKG